MLYILAFLLALAAAVLWYATRIEPGRLIIRRHVLEFEHSQLPLDSLTILHISDIHVKRRDTSIGRRFDRIRAIEADLILITGDFIEFDTGTDHCVEQLAKLRARLGIYGVLGNHDHWYFRSSVASQITHALLNVISFKRHRYNDVPALLRKLSAIGVSVLMNEKRRLEVDGQHVWLAGVDDPVSQRDDLERAVAGIPTEDFSILLAHSPELAYPAQRRGIDLVLAGHTHGGQVRIPLRGAVVSRTRHRVPTVGGLKKMGKSWLHVSPGMGSSVHLRFLCPPEVTLLELRRRG